MTVEYTLITPSELSPGLIETWRAIQGKSEHFRSPYFSPEFTLSVGKVRADARVVVIENDGRVNGFFPFQRGRFGVGRPIGGPLSDFHGVLALTGTEWTSGDLLRAARLGAWVFDHLVIAENGSERSVCSRAASPQIDLSSGFAAYVDGRRAAGSDYIPKTEGLARKLGREVGDVEFTLREDSAALQTLLKWKSQQYLQAGTLDVFGVPWTSALLREILNFNEPQFAGLCSVLKVRGRIVAGHVGMRSSSVLHYWFPVYDPAYAKFSTGIILLLRIAHAVAAQGVSLIDLGKGDSSYKRRLMTGSVEVGQGYVEQPSSAWARIYRLRRRAEALAHQAGSGSLLRLPARIILRMEQASKFR